MITRTLDLSERPAHLSVRQGQLVVKFRVDGDHAAEEAPRTFPCEDLGIVLLDHPRNTITQAALAALGEAGATVVVCGRDHLPVAASQPMGAHTEIGRRAREQIAASPVLHKRLWKQVVASKIRAQADAAAAYAPDTAAQLRALARRVRSGDPGNVEAHAAKVYWKTWPRPGVDFRRDQDGDGLNALLNYGYAVLRAATGRAVVAAGLLSMLGIHHANRGNAFALADDLMEPLRPLCDGAVRRLHVAGRETVDRDAKQVLLGVLYGTVRMGAETGPLIVALHRYAFSYVSCLRGEADALTIPEPVPSPAA